MEALVLLKLKPEHVLQFSHSLASSDYQEIRRACFMHGPFDCAVEVHAPSITEINEVVARIKELSGVADVCSCTILHSWERSPTEHVW